ncbi:MAG: PIN domain-containing protein [Bifidobacteriaceae bacterium]|jgi:toxin-antitoxin system PIN domain toxin|nr:PIN domain-containing protein [Bifidobacteriaceae bacterium]
MTEALLDASVLIALTDPDHEHHARANAWVVGAARFAVCPITEGAVIRYHLRRGATIRVAMRVLSEIRTMPRCEFWPDAVSYLQADLDRLVGHRQVADAYLASLTLSHGDAVLATLDKALASMFPKVAVLLPEGTPEAPG